MRKSVCVVSLFSLLISFGLFAQSTPAEKGMREVPCQIVPIGPFSKSNLAKYGSDGNVRKFMSSISTKSLNWSGYASFTSPTSPEVGSVKAVFGKWTVPKLRPSQSHRYSAAWVGIDGFSNQTVEQIGTAHEWKGGHQINYAWFELYPLRAYEIKKFRVKPHDMIKASVTYVGKNRFKMVLKNLTRRTFVRIPLKFTVAPGAERTSAEWIVEAPSSNADDVLPLAHFSPITFRDCRTTISGVTGSIGNRQWKNTQITMVTTGSEEEIKSKPSHLFHDGKKFVVKWHHK